MDDTDFNGFVYLCESVFYAFSALSEGKALNLRYRHHAAMQYPRIAKQSFICGSFVILPTSFF
jgi:hypothetical protein